MPMFTPLQVVMFETATSYGLNGTSSTSQPPAAVCADDSYAQLAIKKQQGGAWPDSPALTFPR